MAAILYRIIIFYALYAVIKRVLGAFAVYRNVKKGRMDRPTDYSKNDYSPKEDIVDVEYHKVNK
jgi:hypothetical protein